jgi:hypothetical protein
MIPGATRTRGSTIYYVRDYSTPLGSVQTVKPPVTVYLSSRGMSLDFIFYFQVGKLIHEHQSTHSSFENGPETNSRKE